MTKKRGLPLAFFLAWTISADASEVERAVLDADARTRDEFDVARIGSVTVGIVSKGELVWTKSYGMADMEHHVRATRNTVYRIGSITKQFTAVMFLQLVDAGKVSLSDPVEKYFPEVNQIQGRYAHSPPITLVQLATHTSGVDSEPDSKDFLVGAVKDWEIVLNAALPHTHFVREPGSELLYSNIGYAILGAALARASGEPYTDYVRHHIFEPLGMSDTVFEPNDQLRSRIAKGYSLEGNKVDSSKADVQMLGRGFKVPNGAVFTTVDDLAKFEGFEMGYGPDSVLSAKSLEANRNRLLSMDDVGEAIGLGYMWEQFGSTIAIGHEGAVDGFLAAAFVVIKSKLGVIVLTNTKGGSVDPMDITRAALLNK